MTKAYQRIDAAPVGASRGYLNLGLIKRVNTRDVGLTKRIPIWISNIASVIGIKDTLRQIENYADQKVRDECLRVFRVRQSECFQRRDQGSVIETVMSKIEEIKALTKKAYVVKPGHRWIKLDKEREGGWIMVNAHTGDIHRLLGYGKVNPDDCVGNVFRLSAREIILAVDPFMEKYLPVPPAS